MILSRIYHQSISQGWLIVLVALLAAFVFFFRLSGSSLRDYDEAIYAQVAREMVERQDWLTPHFGSELWFEKPPLSIWVTALFFHFFEPSTLWARASSAIAAVLVVIVTYLLGSHLYGRHVGLMTAIPLLTSFEFIKQARNGTTDIMLTLFIMLNLYAYYRLRQNSPNWWYLFWLSFALGFMTKSWAMLIVLVVVAITYLFDEKLRAALWCRQFYWGLGLAASVISTTTYLRL